jgi:mannose-1-phosphate guanylyltransferase
MEANRVNKTHQAIILAGGRGERLRPITDSIPKVMIDINGKPFLQYQIESLNKFGINNIVLCVGYLWDTIKNHFGDGSEFGVSIHYSVEEDYLGTGGAIKLAQKYLEDSFFILNGDTYIPINYSGFESFYLSNLENKNEIIGVLVVYNNPDKIVNNNIIVDPQNYISGYNKVIESENMNGVDAGVTIFDKKILDCIPDINKDQPKISFENDVWPPLIQTRKLLGFKTDTRFYDIGTPERLNLISEVLK